MKPLKELIAEGYFDEVVEELDEIFNESLEELEGIALGFINEVELVAYSIDAKVPMGELDQKSDTVDE